MKTNETFLKLASRRFSCRAYKPDPVPKEMLESIIAAARQAPSACNRQPWRFVVATKPGLRHKLATKGILPGLGMDWIANAPVILVLGMETSFITHRLAPILSGVDYPTLDIGIAGEHAVLQATEFGLGSCWIGWINKSAIGKTVGWKSRVQPVAMITIGWPVEPAQRATSRLDTSQIATWR